jgi:hypothetical protein
MVIISETAGRDDEGVTQTSIHKWVSPRPYGFYGTILGLLGVTSMMDINASESAPLCSSGMGATNIGWAKVAPNEQQFTCWSDLETVKMRSTC